MLQNIIILLCIIFMGKRSVRLFSLLLLSLFTSDGFAQHQQAYNRVQYHKYKWTILRTDAYNIYYPNGSDTIGKYLDKLLPTAIQKVKRSMLADAIKPPNIIIYPSIDQLYESNIGSDEPEQYTFPTFVTKAGRLLLAYTGSYKELEDQAYEAIARYAWETQMPDNLKEQAKGSKDEILLWFKEGAIRYFARQWPIAAEQAFQTSFTDKQFSNWQQVTGYEPRIAGQAFCYYLSLKYQKKVVAQVFFQLKKGKNLPRALRLVTKHTIDSLQYQCFVFYQQRFKDFAPSRQTPLTVLPHKKGIVQQAIINPDKQYITYVTATFGKRATFCYDTRTHQTNRILTYPLPPWIDDHSRDLYPLTKCSGNNLYVAIPAKGKITITGYNTDGSKQQADKIIGADGIDQFSTMSNNGYHLSAWRRGQNGNVIYDVYKNKYSLTNQTGKTAISNFTSTNDSIYITSQQEQSWKDQNKNYPVDTPAAWLKDYINNKKEQEREDSILRKAKDTAHYFMDDLFKGNNEKKQSKDSAKRKPEIPEPYVLQLHSAWFSAKVNNDYLINRYQPYLNYQGQFKFPEVGGMAQGGFADLFEDHHFSLAYRIPSGTEGSDFYAKYENTAKKLDWGLMYFRKVESIQPDPNREWTDENGKRYPNAAKVKTHYYELSLHYPLSYYASIDLQTAIRQDRTVFLASDRYSLDFDPIQSTWSITTVGYTINKLQPTLPNLYKGWKANATVDIFKGFSQQEAVVMGSSVHLRYDQPVYRYITLVTQLHAGYSGGDQKVLYNLGGMDNNVTPRVDTNVHFSQTAPYAFQTLVTPFRGYYQNSLYGNEYLLFNADLYFPIFQTLMPIETALPSINNLQIGIFTDAATAKETWQNNPNNGKWKQSFGLSARTMLAGYPIRIDIALPGSFNKPAVWYFSLTLK